MIQASPRFRGWQGVTDLVLLPLGKELKDSLTIN